MSGPAALTAAARLAGALPAPRRAMVRTFRDADGDAIDRGLLITFPGPASATGEDMAEFHIHGSRAVVAAMERALAAVPGLAPAEAGAFTRRMLTHGRIDLTEAEALADLLAAETETQRRAAIGNVEGRLSRLVAGWNDALLNYTARVEALIDFDDEAEVMAAGAAGLRRGLADLAAALDDLLAQPPAERLRDGIRVALAGPPNSGKSTLFNALVDREAAIVSPIAGTTRDVIEAPVVHQGVAFVLIDAAGLTDAPGDAIERIGVDRARAAVADCDILLWLGDEAPIPSAGEVIALHPRCDLPARARIRTPDRLRLSAATGDGIGTLWQALHALAVTLLPKPDQMVLNRRQLSLVREISALVSAAAMEPDLLLVAERLREARLAIDRLTGRASTEAMLTALFGQFCIGK